MAQVMEGKILYPCKFYSTGKGTFNIVDMFWYGCQFCSAQKSMSINLS